MKQEKQEKQGKTRRWVSVRRRGDPGEIQGRSIDLRSSVFRGVGGSMGKGTRREGVGGTRTIECGGVLGSLVRRDEGRSEECGEEKT